MSERGEKAEVLEDLAGRRFAEVDEVLAKHAAQACPAGRRIVVGGSASDPAEIRAVGLRERHPATGIFDARVDLRRIADDRRLKQRRDTLGSESGHGIRIEAAERLRETGGT